MKKAINKSFVAIINASLKRFVVLSGSLTTVMGNANPQELDVAYVETPEEVITVMLDIASVRRGDYVVDLGTGDGRIAIAAVKLGAVGLGVDLDPQRVKEANENAVKAGVSERVMFLEQDLFDTDFRQASVVTMFLNSAVNLRLRSVLLEDLKPGTRVVSHNFDMEDWQPDKHQQYLRNSNESFYIHDVYCWVIPADARGQWFGEAGNDGFQMTIEQEFQKIKVEMNINDHPLVIEEAVLSGRRINILGQNRTNRTQYIFSGSIEDNDISGIVQTRTADAGTVMNWQSRRSQ